MHSRKSAKSIEEKVPIVTHTRKLSGSPISCCGCWLQRPSPCPASSTVPSSSDIHHSCSHLYQRNSWSSNMGNLLQTVGWRKQGILRNVSHWTTSPSSWPRQRNPNDVRNPNTCSTSFILSSSLHTSFNPQWPVLVHCSWIPFTLSQVGKVSCCKTRSVQW